MRSSGQSHLQSRSIDRLCYPMRRGCYAIGQLAVTCFVRYTATLHLLTSLIGQTLLPPWRLSTSLCRLLENVFTNSSPIGNFHQKGICHWEFSFLPDLQRTSANQTPIPYVPWIRTKREGMKSGRSGALRADRLGLGCNTGTGGLGVLNAHEISQYNWLLSQFNWWRPPQVQVRYPDQFHFL